MNRVDTSMVTTANEIPGYRIVKNFGIVRGIIVRSRSVIGNLGRCSADHHRRQHHHLDQSLRKDSRGRLRAALATRCATRR
jgi:uncharacterized protein YbjQ (UPF0145 family)